MSRSWAAAQESNNEVGECAESRGQGAGGKKCGWRGDEEAQRAMTAELCAPLSPAPWRNRPRERRSKIVKRCDTANTNNAFCSACDHNVHKPPSCLHSLVFLLFPLPPSFLAAVDPLCFLFLLAQRIHPPPSAASTTMEDFSQAFVQAGLCSRQHWERLYGAAARSSAMFNAVQQPASRGESRQREEDHATEGASSPAPAAAAAAAPLSQWGIASACGAGVEDPWQGASGGGRVDSPLFGPLDWCLDGAVGPSADDDPLWATLQRQGSASPGGASFLSEYQNFDNRSAGRESSPWPGDCHAPSWASISNPSPTAEWPHPTGSVSLEPLEPLEPLAVRHGQLGCMSIDASTILSPSPHPSMSSDYCGLGKQPHLASAPKPHRMSNRKRRHRSRSRVPH